MLTKSVKIHHKKPEFCFSFEAKLHQISNGNFSIYSSHSAPSLQSKTWLVLPAHYSYGRTVAGLSIRPRDVSFYFQAETRSGLGKGRDGCRQLRTMGRNLNPNGLQGEATSPVGWNGERSTQLSIFTLPADSPQNLSICTSSCWNTTLRR